MSHASDVTAGTALNRLHFFEYRVHPAIWVLLGLAALDFLFEFTLRGFNLLLVPGQLAGAAPIILAAAILLVARDKRLLVFAGLALAYGPVLQLADRLLYEFLPQLRMYDLMSVPLDLTWAFTLAGTVAIGLALGGIRSRVGWAAVLVGILIVLVEDAWYVNFLAGLADGSMPIPLALGSLAAPLRFVGWGFLLGSALDRGHRLIAFGAGLWLAAATAWRVIFTLVPIGPLGDVDSLNAASGLIDLVAWAALIWGVVTELKSAGWSYPAERTPA
jgi:hypothetical protein